MGETASAALPRTTSSLFAVAALGAGRAARVRSAGRGKERFLHVVASNLGFRVRAANAVPEHKGVAAGACLSAGGTAAYSPGRGDYSPPVTRTTFWA